MSNASQESWYDNPNAPKIPSQQYLDEKANFAGIQICAVFYGMLVLCLHLPFPTMTCRSRGRHRPVLPMHERFAQTHVFHKVKYQVATRGPHCDYVSVCDVVHRDKPPHPIYFLHRQPTKSWWHRACRTPWIPVHQLFLENWHRFHCYVPLEQLVSRWPFGKFDFKLSHPYLT